MIIHEKLLFHKTKTTKGPTNNNFPIWYGPFDNHTSLLKALGSRLSAAHHPAYAVLSLLALSGSTLEIVRSCTLSGGKLARLKTELIIRWPLSHFPCF